MTLFTFLALLAGHLLGDFLLQSDQMARTKEKPQVLLKHVAIVTGLSLLLLGRLQISALLVIFFTHYAIDSYKVRHLQNNLRTFLLDQAAHLAVIAWLALFFPIKGTLWANFPPPFLQLYSQALVFLSVYLLLIPVGGMVISLTVKPFAKEIGEELNGLTDGGKIIGYLERALVFLFIIAGQPAGIGFLVAAKSILRFGDIKDPSQRKITEYIIIGTFLSFGWALLISLLAQRALLAL
ncbi:DUF3307 domain-containing protein [Roseibacillus ishigakijimensis]|uniref:DUF3307 domain-containing protein n=1 Tax=Roseibacillus ishigakijimensis TaxID=454146 RepID=A0A934VLQ6_9BACT|nr:DUF3307 domain-containing protein [Roseibacillus ishigakijimensis]MBK1833492.1 DUF3307 domain-containing protein [Roseibacillus ishigakijimensis]